MDGFTNELQQAAWRVAQAKGIVADQVVVIEELRRAGRSAALAEETLEIMTRLLELFESHEREMRCATEKMAGVAGFEPATPGFRL